METQKPEWRHSKLAEVGNILRHELPEMDYHYRTITMADGEFGKLYGDKGAGPEEPFLLIIPYLMEEQASVKYYVRPSKDGGKILYIDLDRAVIPRELAKYKAAAEGAKQHVTAAAEAVTTPVTQTPPTPPAVNKVTVPPQQPFPTQPPPPGVTGSGEKVEDDPWMGYGSRDAFFRAKDGHFERMERYKIARDVMLDKEYSFRYFLTEANGIVKETGKKLAPNELSDLAFTLAITLYNRYKALKYDANGQILPDGGAQAAE